MRVFVRISYMILFVGVIGAVNAQSPVSEFDNLQTPASPAMILLGEAPAEIERPTTPQGFGMSLVNLFNGAGGAIEIAPFWLKNHPKFTAEKLYNNSFPGLYASSISVGSVITNQETFLSIGIRTRLVQVYDKNQQAALNAVKGQIQNVLSSPPYDLDKLAQLQKEYTSMLERPVFTMEVAAAGAGTIYDKDTFAPRRAAAWVALDWRPKGDDFYATALVRYSYNIDFGEFQSNSHGTDLGIRGNYDLNKFFVSVEYLQQMDFAKKDFSNYRLALVAGYQVSKNLYMTGTFGKDFVDTQNLITKLGVNFGISQNKVTAY